MIGSSLNEGNQSTKLLQTLYNIISQVVVKIFNLNQKQNYFASDEKKEEF